MLKAALEDIKDSKSTEGSAGAVQITARLRSIDSTGMMVIDFVPPLVAIPNDWRRLWSILERKTLSVRDREQFEEGLLSIMSI